MHRGWGWGAPTARLKWGECGGERGGGGGGACHPCCPATRQPQRATDQGLQSLSEPGGSGESRGTRGGPGRPLACSKGTAGPEPAQAVLLPPGRPQTSIEGAIPDRRGPGSPDSSASTRTMALSRLIVAEAAGRQSRVWIAGRGRDRLQI